jgi:hypothetical protein
MPPHCSDAESGKTVEKVPQDRAACVLASVQGGSIASSEERDSLGTRPNHFPHRLDIEASLHTGAPIFVMALNKKNSAMKFCDEPS